MTTIQRNLFGNKISEDTLIKRINAIKSKIGDIKGLTSTNQVVLDRIRRKVQNPFIDISEERQKKLLKNIVVVVLKNICKDRGISGYSGKNKSSLSDLIVSNLTKKELEDLLNELSETVEQIKYYKHQQQEVLREHFNIITRSDKILKSDQNNIDAWQDKSEALSQLEENEAALRCYGIMLKINPNSSTIIGKKANLLAEMGRFEEAVQYYEKAIEFNQYDTNRLTYYRGDLIRLLGNVLVKMGKINEVIELIKKALDDDRTDILPGLKFQNEHAWEDLISLYETLIELQSNYDDDEGAILTFYTNFGDHLIAKYGYIYPPAFLNKAKLQIKRGEYKEALEALDTVINEVKDDAIFKRREKYYTKDYHLKRDKYWREALVQKARISALENNKERLIENLTIMMKIYRETHQWKNAEWNYSKKQYYIYIKSPVSDFLLCVSDLIEDIRNSPEFDDFRDIMQEIMRKFYG